MTALRIVVDRSAVCRFPSLSIGAFRPLELRLDHWRSVTAALGLIDDVTDAHGLVVALAADCDILTARPERYAGLGDDPPVIAI